MGHKSTVKLVEWRERLRRFEVARLSVTAFCAAEGVSTPSFYQWRKRLGQVATRRRSPGGKAIRRPTRAGQAFQRLVVTPAAPIALRLPGGVHVEFAAAELEAVRELVAELLRVGHTLEREERRC